MVLFSFVILIILFIRKGNFVLRELGNMGMGSAVGLLQSFVGLVLVMATNALSKKVDPDGGGLF